MKVNNVIDHLWDYGYKLLKMMHRQAVAHGIDDSFKVGGIACEPFYLTLDKNGKNSLALRTLFAQEMIRNGVLIPWIALSYRHGDAELKLTEAAIIKTFVVYKKALVDGVDKYLTGSIIKPVFRKYN